jgi:alpha-L-rhamnosidase
VHSASESSQSLYLPVIAKSDPFLQSLPIWSGAEAPEASTPQVALFRKTFWLETAGSADLYIFADTRYEVWIDGKKLGRGPARFSLTRREVDHYNLDAVLQEELSAGEHLMAVLVQWAPNTRRSESLRPYLRAILLQSSGAAPAIIAATDSSWQAVLSQAWDPEARQVHTWGLIGPTELLDFHSLSLDWNQPEAEVAWQPAVVVDEQVALDGLPALPERDLPEAAASEPDQPDRAFYKDFPAGAPLRAGAPAQADAAYLPRSIPFLINAPVAVQVKDTGRLLPGTWMGELPGNSQSATLQFSVTGSPIQPDTSAFTIEMLSLTMPLSETQALIQLDDGSLSWQTAGPERPDVITAALALAPGTHELSFSTIPLDGLTFSIIAPPAAIHFPSFPGPGSAWFQQSTHTGRRLLLANWQSDPAAVIASSDAAGYQLVFQDLPGFAILDLGRTVHGRLEAQVSGPPGSIIDIGWDERLWPPDGGGRPLPFPGSAHPEWSQVDSWILDGWRRDLTTIDARAGRYVIIAAWGDGSDTITLDSLRVYEERLPVEQTGSFQSSDPLLNKIWQVGVDSLLPNMTDAYTDTPWRERGQWWGDAYVEDRINQAAFGNLDLLRRGLLYMQDAMLQGAAAPGMAPMNNGLHMLDYSMLWVHSLADYTRRSAALHAGVPDISLARQAYPQMKQFILHLEGFENPQTGLLDLPKVHWTVGAYIETAGYHSRYGQSTALNALYFATLQEAAWLAGAVGDPASAQYWQEQAALVKQALNAHLYLPDEHRYLTTIYDGTAYPPTIHAQAWALAYQVAPEEEEDLLADSLIELIGAGTSTSHPTLSGIQVYGIFWVLDGLGKAGKIEPALEIIRSGYAPMLDAGATTWWEWFGAGADLRNSLSHGWGGSPTWFLTTYLLGLQTAEPGSPGAPAWIFKPALASLESAAGSLPLGDGSQVRVSWLRSPPDNSETLSGLCAIHLTIDAPPAANGMLILDESIQAAYIQDAGSSGSNILSRYLFSTFNLDGKIGMQFNLTNSRHDSLANSVTKSLPLNGGAHQLLLEQRCSP